MILSGEIKVNASQEDVFNKLNDVPFFASCIEGVSDLEQINENQFKAILTTKVAYIQFKFQVMVEIIEKVFPEKMVAKTEGTPIGVIGRLQAISSANLIKDGDQTTIQYSIDLKLTGKLGSMGQPVLRSKTKELEKQFAKNLQAAFV
ncbi:MAG: SRPBCC domain-containing protein [Betaproteobacteria bacterium]|jgi:carbon monoxide dehydrogenase subunit G